MEHLDLKGKCGSGLQGAPGGSVPLLDTQLSAERKITELRGAHLVILVWKARDRSCDWISYYGSVRRNSGNFRKGRKLHHSILCHSHALVNARKVRSSASN